MFGNISTIPESQYLTSSKKTMFKPGGKNLSHLDHFNLQYYVQYVCLNQAEKISK